MHQVPSLLSVVQHGQRQLNSSACFTLRPALQAKMDGWFKSWGQKLQRLEVKLSYRIDSTGDAGR